MGFFVLSIIQVYKILLIFILFVTVYSKNMCLSICKCDLWSEMKRVKCNNHSIIDTNLEVPSVTEIFDLSYNSIQKLDDNSFKDKKFTLLFQLNLSYNMISWITLQAFKELISLRILNLSHNRIESIPFDLFWYNKKLEVLDLSYNKFLDLSQGSFLSHTNLKVLNLSYSQISFIPKLAFHNIPNLIKLDISNNYLIELKSDIVQSLSKLKVLNINNNHLECDEVFHKFQIWLDNHYVKYDHQCNKIKMPKMFEKIMMMDNDQEISKETDLDELWKIQEYEHSTEQTLQANITQDFWTLFDKNINPTISIILGFILGFLIGFSVCYCWLTKPFDCFKKSQRYTGRFNTQSSEALSHLLSENPINVTETPPIFRRQFSNNSEIISTNMRINQTHTVENNILVAHSEIPPPAYCEISKDNIILSC